MARKYYDLWASITAFSNLHQAWRKASLGKRSKPQVASFAMDAESQLIALQAALMNASYTPTPYHSFFINDPKRRWVSAASFTDRVVHHALIQVLEPLFEPTFANHSYANRKGKGTHQALKQAQQWAGQYRYVLQCDIKQFFPSVDHAVLMALLQSKIACQPTLALCELVLASGDGVQSGEYDMHHFADDDLLAASRPRGLPIGNLTSQFWANVYMNAVDQMVVRQLRCPAYLRYVDDFLLFAHDKATLWRWKNELRQTLNVLRLCMHEASSTVYPCNNGIPYLGMVVFSSHIRLKTRNARAFAARFKAMQHQVANGELDFATMTQRVQGWVAHAKHAQTKGLMQAIFEKPLKLHHSNQTQRPTQRPTKKF